jgi:hypothetical protein
MRIEIKSGHDLKFAVKRMMTNLSDEVIQKVNHKVIENIEARTKSKVVVASRSNESVIVLMSDKDSLNKDQKVFKQVVEDLDLLVGQRGGKDQNVLKFLEE